MGVVRRLLLTLVVGLSLYVGGYYASAFKVEGYCGSMPIHDPDWKMIIEAKVVYRFLPEKFWKPVHAIDRMMRSDFWKIELTAHGVVEREAGLPIVILMPRESLVKRLFPTLVER